MRAKNVRDRINEILSETLQNNEESEEVSDDFFIKFINNLMVRCDKNCMNEAIFQNIELASCLKKISENIAAYRKTTQNISNLAKDELSSINTLIGNSDDNSIEMAAQKLQNLQAGLQNELSKAAENIKNFQNELEDIKRNSRLDNLTKTLNLKTYFNEMNIILKKGLERDLDMCMLLIEIPNLKEIRTEHGEEASDKILIYITNVLNSLVRTENKIYRYSDNTFLIVLNRSTQSDLHNTQKRIVEKVTRQQVIFKEKPVVLHISSGISLHAQGDDIESFTQRAKENKENIL